MKYYAVKNGKIPGIYTTWPECEAQVKNFSGAVYKSFKTLAEAESFVGGESARPEAKQNNEAVPEPGPDENYAFVDGSFNPGTNVYGYGGFLVANGQRHVLQGSDDDPEMADMRNVSGEIMGAMAAVDKALELGLKDLVIYFDYMGIREWALGNWKRNKAGTRSYHAFMSDAMTKIDLKFQKVAAHTGIPGNEMADRLAKEAVSID